METSFNENIKTVEKASASFQNIFCPPGMPPPPPPPPQGLSRAKITSRKMTKYFSSLDYTRDYTIIKIIFICILAFESPFRGRKIVTI